jgi:hypothetical protein
MAHFSRHHIIKETPTLPSIGCSGKIHRLFGLSELRELPDRTDLRAAAQTRKDGRLVCPTRPALHKGPLCRKRRGRLSTRLSLLRRRSINDLVSQYQTPPVCHPPEIASQSQKRDLLCSYNGRSWPLVLASHCGQRKQTTQTSRKSNSSRAFPLHAKRPQPLAPRPLSGPRNMSALLPK